MDKFITIAPRAMGCISGVAGFAFCESDNMLTKVIGAAVTSATGYNVTKALIQLFTAPTPGQANTLRPVTQADLMMGDSDKSESTAPRSNGAKTSEPRPDKNNAFALLPDERGDTVFRTPSHRSALPTTSQLNEIDYTNQELDNESPIESESEGENSEFEESAKESDGDSSADELIEVSRIRLPCKPELLTHEQHQRIVEQSAEHARQYLANQSRGEIARITKVTTFQQVTQRGGASRTVQAPVSLKPW